MKFSTFASAAVLFTTVFAAPVEQPETNDTLDVPAEAIINYLDLDGAKDIAVLPFANATDSGILFLNTTILDQALGTNEDGTTNLSKRDASADAEADAWHWIKLAWGQPIYKRDAIADADADADAWHWIKLAWGQPIY